MQLTKNTKFHNRYHLVEKKGSGSFGEVWLARDEQLDNMEVAIKVFVALDNHGIGVFKSEYNARSGLSHPHLLQTYQMGVCGERPYIVMPYYANSSSCLVGQVEELTLWFLIYEVASGLAYLHKKGFTHGNIKPDNILIKPDNIYADQNGSFLITDFCISDKLFICIQDNKQRQNVMHLKKERAMAYLPPEMFETDGGAVNASDIWALGATLYELATGNLPFSEQGGWAQLSGDGKPYWPKSLPYSEGLVDTIMDCLAKEPWNRPMAITLEKRAQDVINGKPYVGRLHENSEISNGSVVPPSVAKETDISKKLINPNKAGTKNKKLKTWLWTLVALAMGGIGFLLGYSLHKATTKDEVFFSYCKDNPTVDNYRAYVSQFPEGDFVTFAQNWIQKWEADSIAKTDTIPKMLKQEKPDEQPLEQPKKELEKKKEDKGEPNNMEKESNGLERGGKTIPSTHEKPLAPAKSHDDNVKDLPKTGLTPAEPNRPSPEVNNPKASSGLTPSKEVNANLSRAGEADEEMAYNAIVSKINSNTATLDDCQNYLRRFSKTGSDSDSNHWEIVAGRFRVLYLKRIQSCKTIDEIDEILHNHDTLMKELHLSGMKDYDVQMKQMAKAMKKKLKN